MRLFGVREQENFIVSLSKVFKSATQDLTLRFCKFCRIIVRVLSFRLLVTGICRQYTIKKKISVFFLYCFKLSLGPREELQKS